MLPIPACAFIPVPVPLAPPSALKPNLNQVWTALVTPFEVSFLQPSINYMFVLNRIIDSVFITDMVNRVTIRVVGRISLQIRSSREEGQG